MKTKTSRRIRADALTTPGGLRRILCSLFLVGVVVAVAAASQSPTLNPTKPTRVLTFAERVAYQRAIEDVYWRHRIWPSERSDLKPALRAVMSEARLEKKVEDYLRKSQMLEDYWQQPVTPQQLQAEMERMAQDTKQPEMLRELFEALGNDPFVIAECLARPVLIQRLFVGLSAKNKIEFFESARTKGRYSLSAAAALANAAYSLPRVSEEDSACTDDSWMATSLIDAPGARDSHTAVWTGSEMIVWGGLGYSDVLNTGGKYDPTTDSWMVTTITDAPNARSGHTAIWTGSEMIVWGGVGFNGNYLDTGGRYNPVSDSWTATSITNAPWARWDHTAAWTGSEMIVWGGVYCHFGCNYMNTGGRYNPNTDSWTATTTTNAPTGRYSHTAVWTGSEMIVWGGNDCCDSFNTGGRYNPITDTWAPTINAPIARSGHTAVWTGSEMIVWGGFGSTGGRYNPTTDSWTATSLINAPGARVGHTAVWTGSEMIVWGGLAYPGPNYFNTGGRYNPTTDIWTITSNSGVPDARSAHTAVWTGSEMIVWGGGFYIEPQLFYLNTGGRYCAQSGAPTPSPTPTATATATATPTATATLTPTPTGTFTPTPTPTATPRRTPTARPSPSGRPRPTPVPR